MGVLANIFGTGEVVKEGIKLIDSFHTSSTEETEAKTSAKVNMLTAYAPFKLAQRVIAFAFTSVFLACFVISLGFVLHAYATGNLGGADQVNIISAITDLMEAFKIPWAVITILLFYFGGGAFEGGVSRLTDRDKAKKG